MALFCLCDGVSRFNGQSTAPALRWALPSILWASVAVPMQIREHFPRSFILKLGVDF